MHEPVALGAADFLGPAAAAAAFVALMSLVKEPSRRHFNAILLAGASGAYLSGGLGAWELLYPIAGVVIAYCGLRSHPFIGAGWLLHAAWDLVHHLYGEPIWPFMPASSFGCLLFDSLIATWFLTGAPSIFTLGRDRHLR